MEAQRNTVYARQAKPRRAKPRGADRRGPRRPAGRRVRDAFALRGQGSQRLVERRGASVGVAARPSRRPGRQGPRAVGRGRRGAASLHVATPSLQVATPSLHLVRSLHVVRSAHVETPSLHVVRPLSICSEVSTCGEVSTCSDPLSTCREGPRRPLISMFCGLRTAMRKRDQEKAKTRARQRDR
jgi:hypothetical protein